jgi:hypothetical protein
MSAAKRSAVHLPQGKSAMPEDHGSGCLDVLPTVSRTADGASRAQSLVGSTTIAIVS